MSKIVEGLLLGDFYDAKNKELIKSNNVAVVINCAKEIRNFFEDDGVKYVNLSLIDGDDDAYQHFDKTFKIIERSIGKKESVLVHCMAGVSRSASIVIAYIMKSKKMNYDDALEYTKNRRPQASPNYHFQVQLCNYELYLVKENILDSKKLSARTGYMVMQSKNQVDDENGEDNGMED